MSHSFAPAGGALSLIDHFGTRVTAETYRGKYVLIFFGFTHCRVICPRTLTILSKALERLGTTGERIQPLYVTVDPERDTPDTMKAFLQTTFPRFLGLTGSAEEIAATKAAYKVFSQRKLDAEEADGYVVPHTALTYILDINGRYLGHFTNAVTEDEVLTRMQSILSGNLIAPS